MSVLAIVTLSAAVGATTAIWTLAITALLLAHHAPRIFAALGRLFERWVSQAL